jgi:hypothetical protein|tara:strand:+ start:104 stop:298 length:195 start_codon:yes stop_codon:yes gene_type:complete
MMLLLGKIAAYIAGATAMLLLLIPIICITHFVMRNAMYLADVIVDEIIRLSQNLFEKLKRKHKK